MSYNTLGFPLGGPLGSAPETDAPLIAVFERDDSMAVALLSQLRMVGYDVRGARTPVELFDIAQKHPIALILVDLGTAAAGRREFWVALDAQRRGRAIQVITFRVAADEWRMESEPDLSARALADVEVQGAHDLRPIIEATVQRVPLRGGAPGAAPWGGIGTTLGSNPFGVNPQGFMPPGAPFLGNGMGPGVLGANGNGHLPNGYPGSYTLHVSATEPHAVPPEAQSPFANPAGANPFSAASGDVSPFDLPLSANPFASGGVGEPPPARHMPAGPAWRGAGNGRPNEVADAWVPPGTDALSPLASRPLSPPPVPRAEPRWTPESFAVAGREDTAVGFPAYDTAAPGGWPPAQDDPNIWDATAPVGAQMPAVLNSQSERALGTVLVEGALLTPQKLDVLKGIQRMLSGVDMDFKLGELALLFKFLSPDQLLAALLVSRGVVTPQQIAGLGRIKQELSVSGMDYDLETLLIMFHILPAEELRRLRQELA
jgi:hypothetical protein